MCRNIRPLFNFEPPSTDDEIRSAALQFVRKTSGFSKPSAANEDAFGRAVDDITYRLKAFLAELETSAAPKDRETVAARARSRFTKNAKVRDRAALLTADPNR
jgi:hypothetical protein